MSDTTTAAAAEVSRVLDAYLPSESRITAYVDFLTRDSEVFRVCDPVNVAMIISAFEGECANPPSSDVESASVAAWAYSQTGSMPSLTHLEFMNSVQSLLSDTASDRTGTLLVREPVEELASGLGLLADALEEGEADSLLSRAFEGVSGLLDAVLARADLDFETSYEGTAVVENTIVEWLTDHMQGIIDYITALMSLVELDVSVRDGLEDAMDALVPALESFVEDLS